MVTEVVKVHHKNAIFGLLEIILDNRDAWQPENISIPSEKDQERLFGGWKLIFKGKKEDILNISQKKNYTLVMIFPLFLSNFVEDHLCCLLSS